MIPGASELPLARNIQSVSDLWGGEVGPKSPEGFNFHVTHGKVLLGGPAHTVMFFNCLDA